jgi:hypothetical protein
VLHRHFPAVREKPVFEGLLRCPKAMAEREGFEPPIGLHLCRISSAVHSTTLPPLQGPPNPGPKPPWSGRVLGEDGWPDKARNDKSVKSWTHRPADTLLDLAVPVGRYRCRQDSDRGAEDIAAFCTGIARSEVGARARLLRQSGAAKARATVPIESERWL